MWYTTDGELLLHKSGRPDSNLNPDPQSSALPSCATSDARRRWPPSCTSRHRVKRPRHLAAAASSRAGRVVRRVLTRLPRIHPGAAAADESELRYGGAAAVDGGPPCAGVCGRLVLVAARRDGGCRTGPLIVVTSPTVRSRFSQRLLPPLRLPNVHRPWGTRLRRHMPQNNSFINSAFGPRSYGLARHGATYPFIAQCIPRGPLPRPVHSDQRAAHASPASAHANRVPRPGRWTRWRPAPAARRRRGASRLTRAGLMRSTSTWPPEVGAGGRPRRPSPRAATRACGAR